MRYNMANIDVPKSCSSFTINLKHTGKMAKNVMGHNVVVSSTADMAAVNSDGVKAGLAADYVKAGDTRVIAHSKIIGGGETTSVKIPVISRAVASSSGTAPTTLIRAGEATSVELPLAALGAAPTSFLCSFPGHAALMKGTIAVK